MKRELDAAADALIALVIAAVFSWCSGCGAPPSCLVGETNCDDRCLSVCRDGEWQQVRCLRCDESMVSQVDGLCRIETTTCGDPNPPVRL